MASVSTSGTLGTIPQNPASPASSGDELEEEEPNNTTTTTTNADSQYQGDTKLPPRPAVPLQKRRRVTRACDECRRKKIKCDGAVHCNHCQVRHPRVFDIVMLITLRFMDTVQLPQQ